MVKKVDNESGGGSVGSVVPKVVKENKVASLVIAVLIIGILFSVAGGL